MDLAVPLAFSESIGAIVLPNVTKSDGPFKCIECDASLVLRQGAVRQYHFAHSRKSHCGGGEGILHRATKHWFSKSVTTATIDARCRGCGENHTVWNGTERCIAAEEYEIRVDGVIRFRVDVAVLTAEDRKMVASVEVFNTHRIGAEKLAHLNQLGPVLEIKAVNPASTGFSTRFECEDPSGWCNACSRKKRLEDLCRTLKPLGLMRAFILKRRARHLVKRLRYAISHETYNLTSPLVECKLCGAKAVETDGLASPYTMYHHETHTDYETLCPQLCNDCSIPRTIRVRVWHGRSTKRPCVNCDAWGTIFTDMFPIKRLYENDYGKDYDWGCHTCRIQCRTCGVYCFNYGKRCLTCNQIRKLAQKRKHADLSGLV
jgi:hypothetical protein